MIIQEVSLISLEIDSPSRGRKLLATNAPAPTVPSLEIDSPSRGRKPHDIRQRIKLTTNKV